jgi:CRISPR-associated protein Csb1
MPDNTKKTITAADVLNGESPLVLVARLAPVANLDRFQPAGFPEVGHVIYRAPRDNGAVEHICIVDSPASMANHLESVCMRGAHDYGLVDDLEGMPYIRCVTGVVEDGKLPLEKRRVVVTSLTEGHRIASTYFLEGELLAGDTLTVTPVTRLKDEAKKKAEKQAKKAASFEAALIREFGIEVPGGSKAHPPAEKWWDVFKTIFRYDPSSLVHGVMFPQWQVKIPRMLTAHLEAMGAARVDRSGVKFDRLGKTTSGQPIFAVDDATAREIRATFILDVSLVRSFGRHDGGTTLGLTDKQKEFLVALALWKLQRLLASPFRFRSGCHLRCLSINESDCDVELNADIRNAIAQAGFTDAPVTDVFWPFEELYREGKEEEENGPAEREGEDSDQGQGEDETNL